MQADGFAGAERYDT